MHGGQHQTTIVCSTDSFLKCQLVCSFQIVIIIFVVVVIVNQFTIIIKWVLLIKSKMLAKLLSWVANGFVNVSGLNWGKCNMNINQGFKV